MQTSRTLHIQRYRRGPQSTRGFSPSQSLLLQAPPLLPHCPSCCPAALSGPVPARPAHAPPPVSRWGQPSTHMPTSQHRHRKQGKPPLLAAWSGPPLHGLSGPQPLCPAATLRALSGLQTLCAAVCTLGLGLQPGNGSCARSVPCLLTRVDTHTQPTQPRSPTAQTMLLFCQRSRRVRPSRSATVTPGDTGGCIHTRQDRSQCARCPPRPAQAIFASAPGVCPRAPSATYLLGRHGAC